MYVPCIFLGINPCVTLRHDFLFHHVTKTCTNSLRTRMHSSMMCTGRSLTICQSLLPRGGMQKKIPQKNLGWGVPGPSGGVYLGGVPGPGGVSGPKGCLFWGASAPRGVSALGVVSQHALRQTPPL